MPKSKSRDVKKRNQKKETDPNAPKKARSAYNLFTRDCGANREELFGTPEDIADNGGYFKCVSLAWKELSAQEKGQYTKLATKDRKRYEKQMEQYEKEGFYDEEEEQENSSSKKKAQEVEEEQEKKQGKKYKNRKRMCGS